MKYLETRNKLHPWYEDNLQSNQKISDKKSNYLCILIVISLLIIPPSYVIANLSQNTDLVAIQYAASMLCCKKIFTDDLQIIKANTSSQSQVVGPYFHYNANDRIPPSEYKHVLTATDWLFIIIVGILMIFGGGER